MKSEREKMSPSQRRFRRLIGRREFLAVASGLGVVALAPKDALAKRYIKWNEAFDSAVVVMAAEIRRNNVELADKALDPDGGTNLKRIQERFKTILPDSGAGNYKNWNAEKAEYVYTHARMIGILARRAAESTSAPEVTQTMVNEAIDQVVKIARIKREASQAARPGASSTLEELDIYCYF